jgi:hypothetical protein
VVTLPRHAYSDDTLAAIDHDAPLFELEFPDDRQRQNWQGNYPLVDYSGDGILAHHPGYPQPCRSDDIEDCENDASCQPSAYNLHTGR